MDDYFYNHYNAASSTALPYTTLSKTSQNDGLLVLRSLSREEEEVLYSAEPALITPPPPYSLALPMSQYGYDHGHQGVPFYQQQKQEGGGGGSDEGKGKNKGRNRSSMACVHCRRRKIRCDGMQPSCSNCHRLGKLCDYEPISEEDNLVAREKKRASRLRRAQLEATAGPSVTRGPHHLANTAFDSGSRLYRNRPNNATAGMSGGSPAAPTRSRFTTSIPSRKNQDAHLLRRRGATLSGLDLGISRSPQGGPPPRLPAVLGPGAAGPSRYEPQSAGLPSSSFQEQQQQQLQHRNASAMATSGLSEDLPAWARNTFSNQGMQSIWSTPSRREKDPSMPRPTRSATTMSSPSWFNPLTAHPGDQPLLDQYTNVSSVAPPYNAAEARLMMARRRSSMGDTRPWQGLQEAPPLPALSNASDCSTQPSYQASQSYDQQQQTMTGSSEWLGYHNQMTNTMMLNPQQQQQQQGYIEPSEITSRPRSSYASSGSLESNRMGNSGQLDLSTASLASGPRVQFAASSVSKSSSSTASTTPADGPSAANSPFWPKQRMDPGQAASQTPYVTSMQQQPHIPRPEQSGGYLTSRDGPPPSATFTSASSNWPGDDATAQHAPSGFEVPEVWSAPAILDADEYPWPGAAGSTDAQGAPVLNSSPPQWWSWSQAAANRQGAQAMNPSEQTAQQHQQQQPTMTTSPSAPAYQASTMASHIPTSLRITQMNAPAPMLPPGLPQPYSSMQGSAMTTARSTRSSASEGANTTGSVHTGTHTPFEQLAHSSSGEVGPASGGAGIITSHGGSPMGDLGQRLGWLHHHTTSPEDERGGVDPFTQQQQQAFYPQEGAGQYQQ